MSDKTSFHLDVDPDVAAKETEDRVERSWIRLTENGVHVKVNDETFSRRPTRTKFFFNPRMITNREITLLSLAAICEERREKTDTASQETPAVEALDAFASSGIGGMRWKKILGSKAKVFLCENEKTTFDRMVTNCQDNGLDPSISEDFLDCSDDCGLFAAFQDCNLIMMTQGFDFIHLDPFGCATHHFDSCFKNVRNGGVVVITSTDTGSLFGKVPAVTRRNYDAFVARTEYFRELAARLVVGAAARAAARCNKGLRVLYAVAMEHFVQVAVRVQRGAQHADVSIEKVGKILHCLVCEERAVFPNSNHPLDATSYSALNCDCTQQGKNRIFLGPLWCGSIFDSDFIEKMGAVSKSVECCPKTKEIIALLINEAACPRSQSETDHNKHTSNSPSGLPAGSKRASQNLSFPSKRIRTESPIHEPMFYYSTHIHVPKGLELIKMPRLVELLRQEGFRASRTHFDTMAVRTDASANELKKVLAKHCKPIPSNRN